MNPKNTIAMKTIQTGNQNKQEHEKSDRGSFIFIYI